MLTRPIAQAALNLTWIASSVQPEGPGYGVAIGFGGTQLEPFGEKISWVRLSFESSCSFQLYCFKLP